MEKIEINRRYSVPIRNLSLSLAEVKEKLVTEDFSDYPVHFSVLDDRIDLHSAVDGKKLCFIGKYYYKVNAPERGVAFFSPSLDGYHGVPGSILIQVRSVLSRLFGVPKELEVPYYPFSKNRFFTTPSCTDI